MDAKCEGIFFYLNKFTDGSSDWFAVYRPASSPVTQLTKDIICTLKSYHFLISYVISQDITSQLRNTDILYKISRLNLPTDVLETSVYAGDMPVFTGKVIHLYSISPGRIWYVSPKTLQHTRWSRKVSTRYPTMSRKDIKRYWLIHISAIFSILHAQSHCRMSSNQTHFMEHSSGTERYFFLVNYFPMKTISLSRYPSPCIDSLCLRSTVGKVMRPSRTVDLSVRSKIMFAEDARFHKENAWNIKTLVQIKDIS